MRHHVEEDVVVEHRGDADLGAALDGDQAVLQFIGYDPGAYLLAQREGGDVHQIHVVLDRRVVDAGRKEHQLRLVRRRRAQRALGQFLDERGLDVDVAVRGPDRLAEPSQRALEAGVGLALELEIGEHAAAEIAPQAAQRVLVERLIVAVGLLGEILRQGLQIIVLLVQR